ncbi:hypothetical protein BC936DRAFT_143841 [Jimgerdemannia flammicorona]|uniref:Secreted protein n=1 Tax=Jimgerdemannia flammicorona TaxID=994334 RepID=A0A433DMD2_9FUNG|nr:hypothetical protein BC936DRAFT_143841 [Jimgerdemannia flammicorona]
MTSALTTVLFVVFHSDVCCSKGAPPLQLRIQWTSPHSRYVPLFAIPCCSTPALLSNVYLSQGHCYLQVLLKISNITNGFVKTRTNATREAIVTTMQLSCPAADLVLYQVLIPFAENDVMVKDTTSL